MIRLNVHNGMEPKRYGNVIGSYFHTLELGTGYETIIGISWQGITCMQYLETCTGLIILDI